MAKLDVNELLHGLPARLSHTFRYSTLPVHRKETVSSHSFYTAFYAMAIANSLKEEVRKGINWEKLMISSLVHDIDEGFSGDLLRHVKRHSPELHKMWTQMCVDTISDWSFKLVGNHKLVDFWKNDKDDTLEGRIIELADFLAVIYYSTEEYHKGNEYMLDTKLNSTPPLVTCSNLIFENFEGIYDDKEHPLNEIVADVFVHLRDLLKSFEKNYSIVQEEENKMAEESTDSLIGVVHFDKLYLGERDIVTLDSYYEAHNVIPESVVSKEFDYKQLEANSEPDDIYRTRKPLPNQPFYFISKTGLSNLQQREFSVQGGGLRSKAEKVEGYLYQASTHTIIWSTLEHGEKYLKLTVGMPARVINGGLTQAINQTLDKCKILNQ